MVQFETALNLGQCKIKPSEINESHALVIFMVEERAVAMESLS